MKKFHIAIGVSDLNKSIEDYSAKLDQSPDLVIENQYALWRTDTLNFSIRVTSDEAGIVRHLGWEDPKANAFTTNNDINGILWEHFNQQHQQDEIKAHWPEAQF